MRSLQLFLRWIKILFGQNYYHQPQRLGKAFQPGKLFGFFNDLTGKTHWVGPVDNEGIPINVLADGRRAYFITTIVQKALGHWDKWLLNHNGTDKEEFIKLCRWLLVNQDKYGGWPLWSDLGLSLLSPYSAMTQGECISAFVRAWKFTKDFAFMEGAKRSFRLMIKPIESKGTAIIDGKYIFFEEAPTYPRTTILNGWIFAIFGLYDYWLATKDQNAYDLFILSFNTLKQHLQEYDAGYWSYYDVRGHLASPFYHDLHIHQITALAMINNDKSIVEFRDRLIKYRRKPNNFAKALLVKIIQKLREPSEVIIIQ